MRRVPRSGRFVVALPLAVVVAQHGGAGGAAGPVVAGHVFTPRERAAVGLRAGEDVVHVRFVAACVDGLAFLAEPGFFVDLIVVAVQIVDVFRDDDACGVLPRTFAVAVARVVGGLANPPKSAPFPDPTMVMKKVMLFFDSCEFAIQINESSTTRTTSGIQTLFFMFTP